MKHAGQVALALTAVMAVGAGGPVQTESGLTVSIIRRFRPASAQTVVDVFCRIPLQLVSPIGSSGGGSYRFAVSVRDSTGLELVSQSWATPVRAEVLRSRGASTSEHVTFAAKAGRYAVQVTVTDSASGRVSRAEATAAAFAGSPGGSDLLLGSDVRQATGAGDTAARGGEVRLGSLFLVTSGLPVLTPQSSKLAYYLELYPAHAESVQVAVRVLSDSGKQIVAAAPEAMTIGAGGGVASRMIDLAGLPPGRYQAEVKVGGPDSLTRVARFGMTGFESVAEAAAVVDAGEWPGGLSEAQLDSAYEPLVYLMSAEEQGVYSGLTLEGKRKWMRQFWARRDPTPGTARNEDRDRFYAAIVEANRRFREGGASQVPGWRTDRGRIFVKYGTPDETLERRQAGSTNPYDCWKYTRTRAMKFVFYDLTGFGNYVLIYTNDQHESGRPNWQDLLGPEALLDVERF
ncbi:MAG TPA: GWxTD domain-containing protein [Gemmatimonadales bacterium]|nr:GWxTD domain-containing protein [Gemmatimonadales bacterium]